MGPAFPTEWAWIAGILGVLGCLLIWRGWRVRRRGETPRCRKCDYNLTGLTSDRCPECGLSLETGALVHGERYRRWWWAVLGVVFMALAGVCLIKPVQQIDWYRFRPTSWVLSDFQSATGAPFQKARAELLQRDRNGKLDRRHRDTLIKLCLAEQIRTPQRANAQSLIDHLAWLYGQDALSDAQSRQFFQQMVELELTVRPRVAPGDDVPFWFKNHTRTPSSTKYFWCDFSGARLYVQDQPVSHGSYGPIHGFPHSGLSVGGRFRFNRPGLHTVVARGHIAFYHGPTGLKEESEPLYETDITAEAKFELLAEEPEDYFTRIDDPALAAKLKLCISPENLRFASPGGPPFQGEIHFTAPPMNVAFEVYARMNGEEYHLGSVYKSKGRTGQWGVDGDEEIPRAEACDIILRSSEKAARHTLDMFDMWEGELVFENVPIKLPQTQPAR
jgi:hypothetical protein